MFWEVKLFYPKQRLYAVSPRGTNLFSFPESVLKCGSAHKTPAAVSQGCHSVSSAFLQSTAFQKIWDVKRDLCKVLRLSKEIQVRNAPFRTLLKLCALGIIWESEAYVVRKISCRVVSVYTSRIVDKLRWGKAEQ